MADDGKDNEHMDEEEVRHHGLLPVFLFVREDLDSVLFIKLLSFDRR